MSKKLDAIKKIIREELSTEENKKFLAEFYGSIRGGSMPLPEPEDDAADERDEHEGPLNEQEASTIDRSGWHHYENPNYAGMEFEGGYVYSGSREKTMHGGTDCVEDTFTHPVTGQISVEATCIGPEKEAAEAAIEKEAGEFRRPEDIPGYWDDDPTGPYDDSPYTDSEIVYNLMSQHFDTLPGEEDDDSTYYDYEAGQEKDWSDVEDVFGDIYDPDYSYDPEVLDDIMSDYEDPVLSTDDVDIEHLEGGDAYEIDGVPIIFTDFDDEDELEEVHRWRQLAGVSIISEIDTDQEDEDEDLEFDPVVDITDDPGWWGDVDSDEDSETSAEPLPRVPARPVDTNRDEDDWDDDEDDVFGGSVNLPPQDDPSLEGVPEAFVYEIGSSSSIGDQIHSHIAQYGSDSITPISPWLTQDGWQPEDREVGDVHGVIYLSQNTTIEGTLQDDGSYARSTFHLSFDNWGVDDYANLLEENGYFGPIEVPAGITLDDIYSRPQETLRPGDPGYGVLLDPGPETGFPTGYDLWNFDADPTSRWGLGQGASADVPEEALELYYMDPIEAQLYGYHEDPLQRVWDFKRQADIAAWRDAAISVDTGAAAVFNSPVERQRYINLAQGEASAYKATALAELWAGADEDDIISGGDLARDSNGNLTPLAQSMVSMWASIGANVHSRSPGYLNSSGQWVSSTSERNAERAARQSSLGNTRFPNGVPWSAAFISSVMDDPMFEGAEGHHTYMGYARLRRARGLQAGEYGAFRPDELTEFRIGDVVCSSRTGGVGNIDVFDNIGTAGSHCDIVTGFETNETTGEREVVMVGGNLSHRVQRRLPGRRDSMQERWRSPDTLSPAYTNFMVIRKADENLPAAPIPGTPSTEYPEFGNISNIANAEEIIEGTSYDYGIISKNRDLDAHQVAYLYYMATQGTNAAVLNSMAEHMTSGHTLYNADGTIYAGQAYNVGWDPGDYLIVGDPQSEPAPARMIPHDLDGDGIPDVYLREQIERSKEKPQRTKKSRKKIKIKIKK